MHPELRFGAEKARRPKLPRSSRHDVCPFSLMAVRDISAARILLTSSRRRSNPQQVTRRMRNRIKGTCPAARSLVLAAMLLQPFPTALAGSNGKSAKAQHPGPVAAATHGPSGHVVEAGAGTVADETNGNSGPKSKPHGNEKPASPQPSLCNAYKGEVRTSCLQTVVGAREPSPAAPNSGSHTP